MQSSLRKNLFKEAARTQIERNGVVGGGMLLGGAAVLTAFTTTWLAPLWLLGATVGGVGLGISGARRLLNNEEAVPELAKRTVMLYHIPKEIPPELEDYVKQAIESATQIIIRIEQTRGQPNYKALSDVVDTVGFLLDKVCEMSNRIIATDRLFDSIQQQMRSLPGGRLSDNAQRDFERNLYNLQQSIDTARRQIVDTTATLQQISLQTLMIQAQDIAMIDDTTGSVRRIATDQAELLQARILAMEEVAQNTRVATGRLLEP